MKERLFGSLVLGAIVGALFAIGDATIRHAALARQAAQVQAHGGHQTVASILAAGFLGVALISALVIFLLLSVSAGRRKRQAPARQRAARSTGRRRVGAGR
jgi:hypothetical protein